MDSQPVINTQDLRKTYTEGLLRRKNLEALRGVSLQVEPGEVFGLLGPNGAGKTTLIKILLGIVRKSSGSASLLNQPAGSQSSRSRVGYLPENLRIARHHTARTALAYYGKLSRMDDSVIKSRSDELLELVGLRDRDRESVRRFSKGMGQRLGLAQALLHNPDLLILDEPTDGLDPVGRSQVRDILAELRSQGKTIFLNSHILQEVELICDRVAILARGEVKAVGTIDELRGGSGQQQVTIEISGIDNETLGILQAKFELSVEESQLSNRKLLTMKTDEQTEVDSLIDALRQSAASIHKLHQGTSTLEEIFLSLVGTTEAAS